MAHFIAAVVREQEGEAGTVVDFESRLLAVGRSGNLPWTSVTRRIRPRLHESSSNSCELHYGTHEALKFIKFDSCCV